jgi:hypothetical protein
MASKRHHYLPRFYIDGFTNSNGFLWVYDKQKDKIVSIPQAPKSIFFELELNTITIQGEKHDIVEKLLSKTDNEFSKHFLRIRNNVASMVEDDYELLAYMEMFINQLFWRTINNQTTKEELLAFYKLSNVQYKSFEVEKKVYFLSDEDRMLILKTLIPFDVPTDLADNKGNFHIKVLDFSVSSPFVICDSPIIYRSPPLNRLDFKPLIFPISSSRVYLSLESKDFYFGPPEIALTNVTLIEQTAKYVGHHDKDSLNEIIKAYRIFKSSNMTVDALKHELFERIKSSD